MNPSPFVIPVEAPPVPISPLLYGIFFEDINSAADGGLYAELIANRSFEYRDRTGTRDLGFACWQALGAEAQASLATEAPVSPSHPTYLRLRPTAAGALCGVKNLGFHNAGFPIAGGQRYRFSVFARTPSNPARVSVALEDSLSGVRTGLQTFTVTGSGWTKYELVITAGPAIKRAHLCLWLEDGSPVDLDLVSLFPEATFNGRINGLRADLAQMLQDLRPAFLRFPGGCIVEGRSFDNMYRWKETIGPLEHRRTNWNRWQMAEYQRPGCSSEDYFQSNGLGFYEFFLLAEDIGAAPLPILNAGMTCQYHEGLLVPMDSLDEFIQDALDLVEFANGDQSTPWGSQRAALGHPKPFGLRHLGIGNEQWGTAYFERYERFHRVLKATHPEVQLITSSGPGVDDDHFREAYRWMAATDCRADLVDEHFYRSPEWFLENLSRYDGYDRSLPQVFVGEYAAHTAEEVDDRKSSWGAALTEAAFLIGVERNSDHVAMTCFAPLFGKTGAFQWGPNLIWFDQDRAYGTPSYYVQQLFATHQDPLRVVTGEAPAGLQVVCSLSEHRDRLTVKVVSLVVVPTQLPLSIETRRSVAPWVTVHLLGVVDLTAENSHDQPRAVSPHQERRMIGGPQPTLEIPPSSVTVWEFFLQDGVR